MADELARLVIRVDSKEAKDARANLDALGRSTASAEGNIGRLAGAGTKASSGLGALASVARVAGPAVAAIASVATLRRVVELGDAYQQVANRVRLFSTSSANAEAVQRSLVTLAAQTRTSLDDMARIYTRISAASSELGASQADVLRLTQGIAQTFALSGASAAEAASSGTQLAQALGSGALAGDELKSILESNLALAQAIAAGFGVSVGELKKMGAEGKLTSEGVFNALLSQTDAIAKRAATIAPTLDSATVTFNTGLTAAVGRLDQMLGLSRGIASLLQGVGEFLANPESFRGFRNIADLIAAAGQFGSGNIGGALATTARNQLRPPTLAETQARDAALASGAFKSGGLLPSAAGGFGFGFGEAERTLSGDRSRTYRGFGTSSNGAGVGIDVAAIARDTREQQQRAKATLDAARKAALDLAADEADGIAEFNRQRVERLGKQFKAAEAALFSLGSGEVSGGKGSNVGDFGAKAGSQALENAKGQAKRAEALFQSLVTSLQTTFSNGIANLFTRGLSSVQDFARSIRDTILRAFADILASQITKTLLSVLSSAGGGGGAASLASSSGGGLSAIGALGGLLKAGGGKIGNIPKGAAAGGFSLGGALGAGGAGFLLGNLIGQSNGSTTGALGGAAGGAATGALIGSVVPGLGTLVGGVIGGAAGFLGGLFGGNSRKKKQQEAARKLAEDTALFADDLIARSLEASGDVYGANKARLVARQKEELAAAIKRFGRASKVVQDLIKTQAAELAGLSSSDTPSGVYQAPAGFDINAYRFPAGRPQGMGTTISTGDVIVNLPAGTGRAQAESFVRELDSIARSQGVSRWSEVYPQ